MHWNVPVDVKVRKDVIVFVVHNSQSVGHALGLDSWASTGGSVKAF